MARRRGVIRASAPRRGMVWLSALVGTTVLPASFSVLLAVLNAAALALRPFTIVRTHLVVSYTSDQVAASELPFGALGMIVVTDTAAAIGITAVPKPASNTDSDWFVWQGLIAEFNFADGTGFQGNAARQYIVDSKAMRKVGNDDDMVIVGQSSATVGAQITIRGRFLVKLH